MDPKSTTAPTTLVPPVAQAPLVNVGDALEVVSAKNRRAFLASLLEEKPAEPKGPDPAPEVTPPEPAPAEQPDLSQDAPPESSEPASSSDSEPAQDASAPEAEAAEAEPEQSEESEDSQPQWDEPAWVEKWKGKQVAKVKAAEERAAELATRVAELEAKTGSPTPPPPNVLATDPEVKAAADAEKQAQDGLQQVRDWQVLARRDPETVAAELQKRGMNITADDPDALGYTLQDLRETLLTMKMEAAGNKRMAEMRAAQRFESVVVQQFQEAVKVYPWLQDRKSREYGEAIEILKNAPWLRNMPNGYLALGHYVMGKRQYESRTAASKAATAPRKHSRPPNIPAPRSAPRERATNPTMISDETRSRALLESDPKARKALVASLLQQR